MLTFVVSHESELVCCLVALCIQIYYGRTVRIFIVNVLDRTRVQRGITPWCGVSTISSFRGTHWDFIRNRILYGVLKNSLVPLDNIRLSDSPQNRTLSPDFPLGSQQLTIFARVSDFRVHSGLFYHPELLIQVLKHYFSQSSNVSFTSVTLSSSVLSIIKDLVGDVVWVNLIPPQTTLHISNYDMLIQSKLSSFIPISSGGGRQLLMKHGLPSKVLWIPLLKAILGVSIEPTLRSQKWQYGNVKIINVITGGDYTVINETNQRYDLLYGLKLCGYVLDCIGEMGDIIPRL